MKTNPSLIRRLGVKNRLKQPQGSPIKTGTYPHTKILGQENHEPEQNSLVEILAQNVPKSQAVL
jgi:hypothetical protein